MIHEGSYKSGGHMIDMWVCSCGWESQPYFDGAEWAEQEWKRHANPHACPSFPKSWRAEGKNFID